MSKAFIFGTFNPCHNAHIQMGVMARNMLGQDCNVIYIPTSDEYIRSWKGYKEGSVLPGEIRAKLLEDAVEDYGFNVTVVEVIGITDGKTYNTISFFGLKDSVLCLGMDNIIQMKKWYKWKELLQNVKLLIFKRQGYVDDQSDDLDKALDQSAEVMDILKHSCGYKICNPASITGISSTEVRKCYINKDMERLKTLVPSNVYQYLEENKNVYF